MITGSCHCGAVVYEVPDQLSDAKFCYCQTCRKLNGSAFAAVVGVSAADFTLLQGESSLTTYESTPGKLRYFCATCHSPMFVKTSAAPDQVRIRLGSLNSEPKVNLAAHIWVKEKPDWYSILDDVPQHEEF